MKKISLFLFFVVILSLPKLVMGQSGTVAERLGYDKDAKLLIVHADDIGLAHSVNVATIKAFQESGISSASIMVPCPWFPEIAAFAKANPEYDFGLHLTLTAEWKNYRWGGVLPATQIRSLLDSAGFFYATTQEVARHAKPEQVEKELRAQVDRAIAFGVKPTHLDSHMGSLFTTPELFKVYLKVGAAYNLPVFIPKNAAEGYASLFEMIGDQQILVDNFYMMNDDRPVEEWTTFYLDLVENLTPGLNEVIIHLAIDDSEMQAVAIDHPDFGAAWRQNDLNTMLSKEFKAKLAEQNIVLVTWGQIKGLLNSEPGE